MRSKQVFLFSLFALMIFLSVFNIAPLYPVHALGSGTIGNNNLYSNNVPGNNTGHNYNCIFALKVTTGVYQEIISSMNVGIYSFAGNWKIKYMTVGIYSDNAGYPGTRLAKSVQTYEEGGAHTSMLAWVGAVSVSYTLNLATSYWLVVAISSGDGAHIDGQWVGYGGSGNSYFKLNYGDGSLPTSFPASATAGALGLSIYASYTYATNSIIISNMDAGNFLFANSKYYNFIGTFNNASLIDVVKFAFSDSVHWVNASYKAGSWILESGTGYATLGAHANSTIANVLVTNCSLLLSTSILDASNIDLYSWFNFTSGTSSGWFKAQSSYFNIYNLGGAVSYQTFNPSAGNASHITKGDIFELQVGGGASGGIQANYTAKNLAALHMLVHISWPQSVMGASYAYEWAAEYGVYYYVNGAWVKGWNVNIEQSSGFASTNDYWVMMHIRWYRQGILVGSSEEIFSYWSQVQLHDTTLWVDLWFGSANASSVGGGRVTAEYYGMTNQATSFWQTISHWFGFTDWAPIASNETSSQYAMPLTGPSGESVSTTQIEMVKYYTKLSKAASSGSYTVQLKGYDVFDKVFSGSKFVGVDTPAMVETKTKAMPSINGGILSLLVSAYGFLLDSIIPTIIGGLTVLVTAFIGALDWLFTLAGWTGGFSQILTWISQAVGWVVSAINYVITLLTSFFLFLATWLPTELTLFSNMVLGAVGIFGILITLWVGFGSAATGAGGFMIGLIQFLPLVLFIWIFASKDFHESLDKVHTLWDLSISLIHILITIGNFGKDLVFQLIDVFKGWL